jgi:glycosyltransferase involved in cell wall biosynthesis
MATEAEAGAETALSVVIPTRDRLETLQRTLTALETQRGLQEALQIVVVDDGSRDGTAEALRDRRCAGHRVEVLRQAPAGPAAARNLGIRHCRGRRVLLLGDDTIPEPGCAAAHLEAAAGREVAVQGMIDWDPEVGVTELMEFMAPAGPQFYFTGLDEGDSIPWPRMVGSNLSAPRVWFDTEPFVETLPEVALEDAELAYRWSQRGWHGVFSHRARCRHHHRYDDPGALMDRQRRAGRAARAVIRRHPELAWQLAGHVVVFGVFVAARAMLRFLTLRAQVEDRWDLGGRAAYFRGLLG